VLRSGQLVFTLAILACSVSCTFEPPGPSATQEIRISDMGYTLDGQSYETILELMEDLNVDTPRLEVLAHYCSDVNMLVEVVNRLKSDGYENIYVGSYSSLEDQDCG
jgi:hypothetical protein